MAGKEDGGSGAVIDARESAKGYLTRAALEAAKTGPPVAIPLAEAVLCISCDVIYPGLSAPCPRCGGKSRLVLQTILHSMACGA